ncbi:tetratricopeptide repeat protein [Aurantimonas sp. VKM B-3413]|uniref:tetratricopeptide repeat protein n=1 Tax=Aurantimonas sp. VKM B-3413 TaxID=2779401 RepID=UPI001E6567E4|nr:tetratricopeptide repeat protein [Aurantimonas sp. VKM B-3413]MCB8837775.1 tetratricopeptide repeat protein [Aurantimonas sp. VKM B-3413]
MSDDHFFREVSEELRQDRVRAVWTRFGAYLLGAAVLVVLVTAAIVGWNHYQTVQANAAGDRYLAAIDLAKNDKRDEALAALRTIAEGDVGPYPDLARMSIASILSDQGKQAEAVAAFDQVAADGGAPQTLRDMASVRSAYILVDTGTLEEVRSHVERLTGDSEPLRFPAREALALAAWKAGDIDTAKSLFGKLADDTGTPSGMASRARLMLDLIAGGQSAPSAASAAGADAAGTAEPQATTSATPAPNAAAGDAPAGVATEGDNAAAPGDAAMSAGDAGTPTMPTTDLGVTSAGGADEPAAPAAPEATTAPSEDQPAEAPATDQSSATGASPAPGAN